jgi:aldehyde dehydrogenase (NAD+)
VKITSKVALEELFRAQGEMRWAIAVTSAWQRIAKLKALRTAIIARQEELYATLWQDFHKAPFETWLTEVFPSIEEIDKATTGLSGWMKDKKVRGVFFLPGARSYLRYEPKGRVLIMAPWNYPFQLLVTPLVSAIAAGNVAIVKPSNKTPATSAFIASLIEGVFPREEVAVVEGPGSSLGNLLLELPFDHVFFTGSPTVGAHVGEAAQRVHAGLTLELGGKSPTVVLPDADLKDAAAKIAWGKCLNAGQTCIAPDYVFCPRDKVEAFSELAARAVKRMYGESDEERHASMDFVRIVHAKACERHRELVEDAMVKGAKLVLGGIFDIPDRYTPPTILTAVRPDMAIMNEEIFGPILPILSYDSIEEVITFIQSHPKPLALYLFGRSREGIDEVLGRTTSGSACINDLIVQIENLNVPFGGIGMSGTGNYHGLFGFKTFSHERNYMRMGKPNLVTRLYPPYGNRAQALMKGLLERVVGMAKK